MKIYDCFTFFNETELLEIRFRLLDKYVDHFVIAESDLTHSGNPKPFNFEKEKPRFAPWMEKIIYIPVHQCADGLVFNPEQTRYDPGSASWKLENEQRDALSAIRKQVLDEDLVIISDLDELPHPGLLSKFSCPEKPLVLSLLFHYYFMNCQNKGKERWWNGCIISSGKYFKAHTPQEFRDNRHQYRLIKKAGWHFSYLGGVEMIKYKLRSFAHTEFNKEEYMDDDHIMKAITGGKDILKRPDKRFRFVPISYYPRFLQDIMKQYPSLIYLEDQKNPIRKLFYFFIGLFNR